MPENCVSNPGSAERCGLVDIQFAVFAFGESGKDSVFAAADGRFLHDSSAYLFRQGDMLQPVIETNVRRR